MPVGSGRDSNEWGAVELVAEGGKDGRDGDGRGRPGKIDDDELADIGSEGEKARYAGTPMSARPNVPAARDPTRRRAVARGMFPENLLFRMAWTPRRLPEKSEKQPPTGTGRSKTICLVADQPRAHGRGAKSEPNLELAARRPKIARTPRPQSRDRFGLRIRRLLPRQAAQKFVNLPERHDAETSLRLPSRLARRKRNPLHHAMAGGRIRVG